MTVDGSGISKSVNVTVRPIKIDIERFYLNTEEKCLEYSVNVENSIGNDIIIAIYDGNHQLYHLIINGDLKGCIPIKNDDDLENWKIEVMLWNSIDSMKPILDKVETEIELESELDGRVYEIVECINENRKAEGLTEVVLDIDITQVSQAYSEELASNNYLDTKGKDGSTVETRLEDGGIVFESASENLAKGNYSPQVIANAWMSSQKHKANILNAAFSKVGVGITIDNDGYIIWVVDFVG